MQNRESTGVGGKKNSTFYMLAIHLPTELVIADDYHSHRNGENDAHF